jgi:hypothetical protein
MRTLGAFGEQAWKFGTALGEPRRGPGHLLVVGERDLEPWHFVAHLRDHAVRGGREDLLPVLLRWRVPAGAPPHLAIPVDRLGKVSRDQTVLVIDPLGGHPELLERVADARRRGARIATVHKGQAQLLELSHETLLVDSSYPDDRFEMAQHLVSLAAPLAPGRMVPPTGLLQRWRPRKSPCRGGGG